MTSHSERRGQVGMEYLMIMGFVFVILIPTLAVYFLYHQNAQDEIASTQLRAIATKITDAAETVYYLGEPTQTRLTVTLPGAVRSSTVQGREIVFTLTTSSGTAEVVAVSAVNMTGSLPQERGTYRITVAAAGDAAALSYT